MSANQTAIDESVLRTIKTVESGLSNKIDLIAAQINQKMLMINEKMDSMSSEYKHLTSNLSEYKFKLDKVDQFTSFQNKANDLLTTHDIRINSMMSELSSAKIKYDKIFIDNLTVPGYIGEFSQYKTLREYLSVNISQVSSLVTYKDKMDLDLKQYKDKLESLIFQFSQSLNQFSTQQITYCNDIKRETFLHVDEKIKDVNENIEKVRIENGNEAVKLRQKGDELKQETEKVITFKKEITDKFEEEVKNFKGNSEELTKAFEIYKKEFNKIRSRFSDLVEFIKDVRFRRNLVDFNGVTKREVNQLANKLDGKKKGFSPDNRKPNIEIDDKPVDVNYDFFTGQRRLSKSDDENDSIKDTPLVLQKLKEVDEETPIEEKPCQTIDPNSLNKQGSNEKSPKIPIDPSSYTKSTNTKSLLQTSNNMTPHYALPTKSQGGPSQHTRNHSMNKRLRSGTKIKLGEPQPQVKEKIVTLQFGGVDAFGGNPSYYDNTFNNNMIMSNTFYSRPPTKKFGTVQENPKNMSRLLNSSKNKNNFGRTSIDCATSNGNVNVKTEIEKVLSNVPKEKVTMNVDEISKIFKDE